MFKSPLKYIAYYDLQDSTVERNYVTSAANKLEYIAKTIASQGVPVEIISAAKVRENKFRLYPAETKIVSEHIKLRLEPSFGGSNKIVSIIRLIWGWLYMFFYLLCNTHKGENIIVYHSLGYFHTILWAKKIRKFRMILETEEIYTDVGQHTKYYCRLENAMFKAADAFIFSTEKLNEILNKDGKPYVVIYGTYQIEPQIVEKFNDGKIHVVYAGTFDPRKGGAASAIMATAYLPENYHVHICGFGNKTDTELLKDLIKETAAKSQAQLSFEGLLKGRDYIRFIQSCHIGLSTQKPTAAFNATSFPSKILSYMANGLSVVSVDIPVVRHSLIGRYVEYCQGSTPGDIANAIMTAKLYDNRENLRRLRAGFITDIDRLLKVL